MNKKNMSGIFEISQSGNRVENNQTKDIKDISQL